MGRGFFATVDTIARRLTLAGAADSAKKCALTYALAGDRLSLDGPLGGDSLHLRLRRVDPATFRVLRGGFHWVSE